MDGNETVTVQNLKCPHKQLNLYWLHKPSTAIYESVPNSDIYSPVEHSTIGRMSLGYTHQKTQCMVFSVPLSLTFL